MWIRKFVNKEICEYGNMWIRKYVNKVLSKMMHHGESFCGWESYMNVGHT